jgi:hypothetical protein
VEASGEPAEVTVAEVDELRRQEEAERANRLYAMPMGTDGPRFDEPATDRFSPEIPDDLLVNLKDGEGEQIGEAFVAAGLGLTTRRGLPQWSADGRADPATQRRRHEDAAGGEGDDQGDRGEVAGADELPERHRLGQRSETHPAAGSTR